MRFGGLLAITPSYLEQVIVRAFVSYGISNNERRVPQRDVRFVCRQFSDPPVRILRMRSAGREPNVCDQVS